MDGFGSRFVLEQRELNKCITTNIYINFYNVSCPIVNSHFLQKKKK